MIEFHVRNTLGGDRGHVIVSVHELVGGVRRANAKMVFLAPRAYRTFEVASLDDVQITSGAEHAEVSHADITEANSTEAE